MIPVRVGVVGAGITGLAVTHYLAAGDIDVLAFEAAAEPGGVIRSASVDGRVLEYGPQRLRLTPAIDLLVEELDLGNEVVRAEDDLPLYVVVDDELRLVPKSPRAFLRTDLLSWSGKARLLFEPVTGAIQPDELAGDVFVRKFGREAYHHVIEPLFGGMYGSDPTTMPAEHALDRLMSIEETYGSLLRGAVARLRGEGETPPPATFKNGLGTLPRALYERHAPYVHLDTPVHAIIPADDGYELQADARTVDVDHVVVTAPAPAAARMLEPVDEALSSALRELTYNSLALVHLAADDTRSGFGYQIARGEGYRTLGVTWNGSLFGRGDVYTAFFGGMWDPAIMDESPAAIGRVAQEEFAAVMGTDAEVLSVTKMPDVIPAFDTTWTGLTDVAAPAGLTLATNYTGNLGIPSRIRDAGQVANRLADAGDS